MARFLLGYSALMTTHPDDLRARWLLIQSLERQRKMEAALDELRTLLARVEKDLPAIDRIAEHMRRRRYPLDAVLRAYGKYLSFQPKSAVAAFNYAYNLARDGQFDAAIKMYKQSLELGISDPEEVHLNIANIFMDQLHDHAEARAHLEKALAQNPAYSSAYYNLGNLAEQEGDRQAASAYFEKSLELDPANESALARLADTRKFERHDDPILERLEAAAQNSKNSDVYFALGKAHEQLRDFDTAWRHFSTGNALDSRAMSKYRPEQAEAWFESIATQCSSEWLAQYAGSSHDPVFICGMFRSGSTLLEQMLAAHPAFAAGGESEFFPRLVAREIPGYPRGLENVSNTKLQAWRHRHAEQSRDLPGDATRLTDKRPDNFLYIGLIKAVLPSAQFIVTERDWRDIATSIYSVRLGPSQVYATRLEDIRHYIGLQEKLVDHWEQVLGPGLKRVRYDDLVLRPQQTLSDLLAWLGKDWDDRCLQFHELTNAVKTASVWQVREPLHPRSVGRWKNYEQHFAEALGHSPGP